MLKKIIKFFSPTESYWNWETPSEYVLRTMPIIVIIILFLIIIF